MRTESNFKELNYFVVAAEEMNFTRAARKMFITQQALSKHIRNLEAQYEVCLFERHPSLRLTLAGEQLLKYARRVIREETQLFNNLKSESGSGSIRLTIGLPTMRGSAYFPGIIQRYHSICPHVVPSYQSTTFAAVNTALRTGDIDLYFSGMVAAGKYGRRTAFVKDETFFVISEGLLKKQFPRDWRDFLKAGRYGIAVADTACFPLILPPEGTALRTVLDDRYEKAACSPNVLAELAENGFGPEMCVGDSFAAFMSKSMLFRQSQFRKAPVYALRLTDMPEPSWLGIVYSESENIPGYVTDYIECAREVITSAAEGLETHLLSLITADGLRPLNSTR